MRGLCPRCGRPIPIIASQGREGSSFFAVRRRCDKCRLTATEETTYELDADLDRFECAPVPTDGSKP